MSTEEDEDDYKKTRLVMRPDAGEAAGAAPPPRAGSIIGTTRLVGDQGQRAQSTSPGDTSEGGAAMKTQLLRGADMETDPVAGWIVVVKGPGRGNSRPVYVGMNSLGRSPNQRIPVDFGDEAISREEHAFITYDDETRTFYLQHGGKSNIVRLEDKPVLQPTVLEPNHLIRIGNTTFRFVAFCGPDFSWSSEAQNA